MKRLLIYLKAYLKECIIAPAFKMLEALFDLFVPLIMADIIDIGIPSGNTEYILRKCGLMILLGIVGLSCSLIAQFYAARAACGFSANVRHALFSRIQHLPSATLDRVGASTLITRMTSDVAQIQNGVNMVLRLFLRSPFIVFGCLILSFTIDLKCALVFAVTIPILFLIIFGIMAVTTPGYRNVQSNLDAVTGSTRENLTGVRVIRAFHRESDEMNRFRTHNQELADSQIRVGRISGLMNPLTYAVINLGVVFILWFGGISVQSGALQQGDIIALVNYMSQVLVELVKLANTVILTSRTLASAGRIASILELEQEPDGGDCSVDLDYPNSVCFEHVSFTYPGASRESLTDITFTAKAGMTVGIIGGTGSGKSTMAHLISGLYPPAQGSVAVFGKALGSYDLSSIRRLIGVVPQKAQLFAGSLRYNLTFGCSEATDEDLWNALGTAQAADFVQENPDGLDAQVEQGGCNYSGGQRQRLTIARALAAKPQILILDDSASALDYATDARLRSALKSLPSQPTTFIISQRVSSLQHADLILVLDDGVIIGRGTHKSLLDNCAIYREIYESQFSKGGEPA